MSTIGRGAHLPRDERGSMVMGWLTKLVVFLAILGVIGFDAISIGAAHLTASDEADSAAEAANLMWVSDHETPIQQLYQAAEDFAEQHGDSIPPSSFVIDQQGNITLTLEHHVTTLVVRHVGPLKHFSTVSVTGTATTPAP
jgi:hypothetical protein